MQSFLVHCVVLFFTSMKFICLLPLQLSWVFLSFSKLVSQFICCLLLLCCLFVCLFHFIRAWFNPTKECLLLRELYALKTGDILVLQDRFVELRDLTPAEKMSVSLVEAAERAPYATATAWPYNTYGTMMTGG